MTTFDEAAAAYAYGEFTHARPLSEWHEDMGPMLWWAEEQKKCPRCNGDGSINRHANLPDEKCPTCHGRESVGTGRWIGEPPYVGSPLDLGITVEAHVRLISQLDQEHKPQIVRRNLGGWPGYHTHFTPIPRPKVPK